jgi:hypothetical protein
MIRALFPFQGLTFFKCLVEYYHDEFVRNTCNRFQCTIIFINSDVFPFLPACLFKSHNGCKADIMAEILL